MKLKYYLRGLGSGIIIATAVLAIAFAITNRDANIISKARELGMIFAEEKENTTKDSESTSKNDKDTSSEEITSKENDEATTDEPSTEEPSSEEPTTEEPTTEEPTTEEPTTEKATQGKEYVFVIKRGMTSESVAWILYKAGIIDNVEMFNDYLKHNGYATRIKIGTFVVHKGDSYETLAKIVTRTP